MAALKNSMGGNGPLRFTGTSLYTLDFKSIEADGSGNMVIDKLFIDGTEAMIWNGLNLAPGQALLSGSKTFTGIQLTSGSGFGYQA